MSLARFRSGGRALKLPSPASSFPPPKWHLSTPHESHKSIFIARCARVHSPDEAFAAIDGLFRAEKKVRESTHNMLAYRISTAESEGGGVLAAADDDGERGAGQKIAACLEAMDARNVVVVVSRWYGGVALGPARFRLIVAAAKEAVATALEAEGRQEKKKKRYPCLKRNLKNYKLMYTLNR